MKNYQHILCPIDFTEHSDLTLEQAISIRDWTLGQLSIVHFIEPLSTNIYGMGMTPAYNPVEFEQEIISEAKKEMVQFVADKPVSEKETQVLIGQARHAIPQFIEENNCDLVMIGGRGVHGFVRHLLGSTASTVVNRVDCDVFVIKGKYS